MMIAGIGCFVSTTITLLVRLAQIVHSIFVTSLNLSSRADILPSFNHQGSWIQAQTADHSQLTEESAHNTALADVRPLRALKLP